MLGQFSCTQNPSQWLKIGEKTFLLSSAPSNIYFSFVFSFGIVPFSVAHPSGKQQCRLAAQMLLTLIVLATQSVWSFYCLVERLQLESLQINSVFREMIAVIEQEECRGAVRVSHQIMPSVGQAGCLCCLQPFIYLLSRSGVMFLCQHQLFQCGCLAFLHK